MVSQGFTHLYTGSGKGKTTAALGLALRATGAGLNSFIIQFMKGQHYSELEAIKKLDGKIIIEQWGDKRFCEEKDKNLEHHLKLALQGLARAKEVLVSKRFSIIILDEIITACLFKLISEEEILSLIKNRPEKVELILTGRGATPKMIEQADLVTEMKEIKHYFQKGQIARKGIES